MNAVLLVASTLVLFAMAGCVEEPAKPVETPTSTKTVGGLAGDLKRGAPEPEVVRSLEAAPEWRLGEYWKIRLQDAFTGKTWETTRVVAGEEGDNYLVGMPVEAFSDAFMVLHIPGFGVVDQLDLGYEIHDVLFIPVQFPLTQGAKWATAFEGRAVNATVTAANETHAVISMVGKSDKLTLTYSAAAGEIVRFVGEGYATYEVVEHGYNYTGNVLVPHEHDVVLIHGRLGGGVPVGNSKAGAPIETVKMGSTYDRVSFAIILGPAIGGDPGVGYYKETVVAPDGTRYELDRLPTEGPGLKVGFFFNTKPAGDWTLEHIAIGPGIAFVEGIGYHSFEASLPSGCVVSGGGHSHGGEHTECASSHHH
jgi:hypothetical protein